jgi:pimeloyl-ACP methyl ester carboxylesterase
MGRSDDSVENALCGVPPPTEQSPTDGVEVAGGKAGHDPAGHPEDAVGQRCPGDGTAGASPRDCAGSEVASEARLCPSHRDLPSQALRASPGETVVLVHGLGGSALVMYPLAARLKRAGYGVVNWTYSSFRQTIEKHGHCLCERLKSLDADPHVSRIHLVTHSMGSLVGRCALRCNRPTKLGRMVMLAPPNLGSPLAAFWGPKLRWCTPIVDELAKRADSFVNCLPPPEGIEIGIIAASLDFLVGAGNTYLACQRDHILLPATHTFLLFRRCAAEEVIHFLSTSHFSPTACREQR